MCNPNGIVGVFRYKLQHLRLTQKPVAHDESKKPQIENSSIFLLVNTKDKISKNNE
jgi:hypothetical protein